jgi:DNA-binding MarR family transcriptional regulator
MAEHSSIVEFIADDLLDLIPGLLRSIRSDIPREGTSEDVAPELRDISELRATTGQVRLLRILVTRERCTMQELADLLDVAPPTATSMIKRLLAQGFVERLRDEQDWRVVLVLPTERGKRAVAVYDAYRRANLQRRLAHLHSEELARLRAALPILRQIIEVEA